jgi:hypothetical protein
MMKIDEPIGQDIGKGLVRHSWLRYISIISLYSFPAVAAAGWFGLHRSASERYFLQGRAPYVFFALGVWSVLLSTITWYLTTLSSRRIDLLNRTQKELLQLLGFLRIVEGAKARTLREYVVRPSDSMDLGHGLFEITRPDLQIRELVKAVRDYFSITAEPIDDSVWVRLIRVTDDDRMLLEYEAFAPDSERGVSAEENVKDAPTMASAAFHNQKMIISPGSDTDASTKDSNGFGSMFAYPVVDDLTRKIIFVFVVISSRTGRFSYAAEGSTKIVMEVFAQRLVLEDRLSQIGALTSLPERSRASPEHRTSDLSEETAASPEHRTSDPSDETTASPEHRTSDLVTPYTSVLERLKEKLRERDRHRGE